MELRKNPYNFKERIKKYSTAIEMHTSEKRYQTKPDLNEIYSQIQNDLQNNPSIKEKEKLEKIQSQIENIQKNYFF